MGVEIMKDSYYDGISPERQAELDKMSLEELEAEIEAERKRCENLTDWE